MKKYHQYKVSGAFLATLVLFILSNAAFGQNMFRKITDFDGDGKTDFAVTRNENGLKVWYVWQSTAGYRVFQWGLANDQVAAGDYDGDGKTDFAIFRITNDGNSTTYLSYYIFQSSTNSLNIQTSTVQGILPPQIAVGAYSQDYDGDGKTDASLIFAPLFGTATIVINESSTQSVQSYNPSANQNIVRVGDLTGDGKSDFLTYNSSTYDASIVNYATRAAQNLHFGKSGDQFVAADFDGDGTGDLSVWRDSDGSWWFLRSSDGTVQVANWGTSGDIPVAGDYDGDGKTDTAIWRRSSPQSYFWVNGSQTGVQVLPFGVSLDAPVRY